MRILGIDPATQKMGYAVLDQARPRPLYVEAGTLVASDRDRSKRIVTLGSDFRALLIEFKPNAVHVETAKWGGYSVAAGALGEIRGCILWICAEHRVPIRDWAPAQIRSTIGVGGSARKPAVASWVRNVLQMNREPEPDAADALAVALAGALAGA